MNKSRRDGRGLLLIAGSILLSAAAQLFMKVGMLALGDIDLSELSKGLFLSELSHCLPSLIWVCSGLFFYALSLIFWLAALTRYQLSLAYPLLSLSYVLVYVGAVLWPRLHETISVTKTVGILFILGGVFLVTRETRDNAEIQVKKQYNSNRNHSDS